MSFIGIVSDNKSFDNIKNKILENITEPKINILSINLQSINNLKNIKFETIIIDNGLEKLKGYEQTLEQILKNAKYLVINTDINSKIQFSENDNIKIISYGLNHKATVTISSITDENILIYLQRNIKNLKGNILEVEEKNIKIGENESIKIYEILILHVVSLIYNQKIINEM